LAARADLCRTAQSRRRRSSRICSAPRACSVLRVARGGVARGRRVMSEREARGRGKECARGWVMLCVPPRQNKILTGECGGEQVYVANCEADRRWVPKHKPSVELDVCVWHVGVKTRRGGENRTSEEGQRKEGRQMREKRRPLAKGEQHKRHKGAGREKTNPRIHLHTCSDSCLWK